MSQPITPAHRRGTNLAIALGFGIVAGLGFALLVGGGGFGFKDGAGVALILLVLLLGGGVFVAQATESLAHRVGPWGRRVALVGLGLGFVGIWTSNAIVAFEPGADSHCRVLEEVDREALEAVLGSGPDALDVFVPTYPQQPRPPAEFLARVEVRPTENPVGYAYEVGGVTVSHKLLSDDGPEIWGPPRIQLGDIDAEALAQLWGAPEQDGSGRHWRRDARIGEHQSLHLDCPDVFELELRQTRSPASIVGPSPERPLADFEGPLVGRTLTELGIEPISYRTQGSRWTARVKLTASNEALVLELRTDDYGRVTSWSIDFNERKYMGAVMEAIEHNFGPYEPAPTPARAPGAEHFRSAARPELAWTEFNAWAVLYVGDPF